ncbi:hypothetical protein [Rhodovulum adriaticum]|uniref:Uncharacterized protein n=2 Tax=Rhodovulum adriaticum TaxID=35804 RepID=A0A4R2NE57_RHOAD|nr:hypothetical protein [Rhodovulum adriaticum]TCP19541.1 hypothetical protein EV656_1296 [Rhodovulum adriaticum]
MTTQLIKIESNVIGWDAEGYDMIQAPFSRLPMSVAHYYEAPNCSMFLEQDNLFPPRFELDLVGVKVGYEPIVAWNCPSDGRSTAADEHAEAEREDEQARIDEITMALMSGWVPPGGRRMVHGYKKFWAGVYDVHKKVYYIDTTEYPDDKAAGLAATKIADSLVRQVARKSIEQGVPIGAGGQMQTRQANFGAAASAMQAPQMAQANVVMHEKA